MSKANYVLFAWQSETVIVLDHYGQAFEGMSQREIADLLLNSNVTWEDNDGVYLAEVRPYTIHYQAGDCDMGLNGSARLATKAELEAFTNDEYWHDLGVEMSVHSMSESETNQDESRSCNSVASPVDVIRPENAVEALGTLLKAAKQ